jgi:hypothetical protein
MNTQRWLALIFVASIVLCAATSSLWLAPLRGGEEEQTAALTTTPQAVEAEQPAETPTPSGVAATVTPTLDPAVADIMADLGMQEVGIGIDPHIIIAGDFQTIDAMHRGTGTASIYQFSETQRVLRLEPFEVTSGPDLRVLLSEHKAPHTSAEALLPTYADLGALKSQRGSQNYEIPPGLDVRAYHSVVIYSMSLNIVYSTATLTEVRGG